MNHRTYTSPVAFKQALDQRLRTASSSGADFVRRRQLLVFDRFLARVVKVMGNAVLLKGGLVLELRLERARATKDIDLRLEGAPGAVLEKLQEAGRLDLGDFMVFEVGRDPDHQKILNDGMQYEGQRFRAHCRLAGKLYGYHFGVDVVFGDRIHGELETATAEDMLAFAGIAPPSVQIYPIEIHIAEKLHAYTMPRTRPNTRVKDLPDMALLGTIRVLEAERLREALEKTFVSRTTHPIPQVLPEPSAAWSAPYVEMARENDLAWATLEQVTKAVRAFLDPVLTGRAGAWSPDDWAWR